MLKVALKHNLKGFQWKSKLGIISTFFAGQGLVQLINVLSGFLLIRWLSVEDYAQYSVAFAFQATAQTLVELGFSGAIIALVGARIYERKVIGEYIKAGKFFRNRMFMIVGSVCIVAFPWLTAQHGWPVYVTVILLIAILSNLYFAGYNAYYASPLKMHRKLKDFYGVQVKTGLGKLVFIGILTAISALSAWAAAIATSVSVWYNGRIFREKASPYIQEPSHSSIEVRQRMFRYVRPVMPGIIYSAFSAQIALFIISIFGKSSSIAEVGALGRIGQLFLILNAASTTLVVPFLARQPEVEVKSKYLKIVLGAILLSGFVTLGAFVYPDPLLWIIGSKYAHLEQEVGLLVLNSSITFINVLMWDMNCSRRWLWSWIPIVSISSNVVLQVLLVIQMDLSTTYNVLIFSIILSVSNLLNKILVAIIGLFKSKDETNLLPAK